MTAGTSPLPRITYTIIFAATESGLIGRKGALPWDCPEDLAHFKEVTSKPNSVLMMGYKTWESLPIGKSSGEKLVGRKKLVVTNKVGLKPLKDTAFVPTLGIKDI